MDYQAFLYNLSEFFIFEDDAVNDENLILWIMSLGEPTISSIQLMKDRGNSLYKNGNISLAGSLYTQALNFLCFVGFLPPQDQHGTFSLAVSLVLNLAACELKLSHFELASRYCKFVVHFDPCNVKALYRRGLAYKKLDLLKDALEDFEHVLHLDPNNAEARRELLVVVDRLAVNPNGKRIAFPFDPLCSSIKGKKPLLSVDVADMPVASCSSSSCSTEPMITEILSGKDSMLLDTPCEAEVDTSPVVEASQLGYGSVNKGQMTLPCSASPASPMAHMDFAHSTLPDASSDSEASQSSSSTASKLSHLCFSNKKRPHTALQLSTHDYDNLLHGKILGYYHPRSMSFMRVWTLTSKTIQTGTPHEVHGPAEVPTFSPLPENLFTPINVEHSEVVELVQEEVIKVDMTLEDDQVVQEDVLLQIAKKKRVSSNSAQVSKISAVQYQFPAARDHRNNENRSCRLKKAYSYRRRPATHGIPDMKTRSPVSVDFSLCLCRYTKKFEAVKRVTRERRDLFQFDEYYHPPYKKRRLNFSVSYACNVRSVSWLYTSLQNSGFPGFVL